MENATIYAQRRARLLESLDTSPVVLTAFTAMQQTNDSAAPFIQESNFFYLTGIVEPDWKLLLTSEGAWLIAPSKTDIQRTFDGGMSDKEAEAISGISAFLTEKQFAKKLVQLAEKHSSVYTVLKHPHSSYFNFSMNPAPQKTLKKLKTIFKEVLDCRRNLSKLKAIKTDKEIQLIQKAIDISIEGFRAVQNQLQASEHEYQLEATLSYEFRSRGAEGHAYTPIVGAGINACTLHYIANKDKLPKNGMVLIDAGAKVGEYASDITRTYAVGTPSAREQAVHGELEKAQKAIIELIQPGVRLEDYQKQSDKIMRTALGNLDLIKKPSDFQRYFPHAVSHGLGIDVHDSLGGFETFQPGMVLTVEPGIYITEEKIGVRIEDDILVTEQGNINLSAKLPTSL